MERMFANLNDVQYARVVIDQGGEREYDYGIPKGMRVEAGMRVKVPLRNREVLATVVEILNDTDADGVKWIRQVLSPDGPVIRPELFRLAQWMANYYACPLGVALRAVVPEVILKGAMKHKQQLFVELAPAWEDSDFEKLQKRAPKQAMVVDYLKGIGHAVSISQVQKITGLGHAALRIMEKKGLVVLQQAKIQRDPHAEEEFLPSKPISLNEDQQVALQMIQTAIDQPEKAKPVLLFGVTGSGKTEVYLQAIDHTLKQNKSAIVLVPEIALTPQTVERFKSRFSDQESQVAVLHSHLSAGERHDEWHKIHSGQARIVIGARSAIFAPLQNLGLIVVDEEHEPSYKQEEAPRYHGRDIAVVRAHLQSCAVVLGSATPAFESYQNAESNKYQLALLKKRVDTAQMPFIRVIDMRLHGGKNNPVISEPLRRAVEERLSRGEQTILFLNRRGYNTSLTCNTCGHVYECRNCSIAMTFHRGANRLNCHLCGHAEIVPKKCIECKDPQIRYSGTGTEKVEELVAKIFPQAKIARMDADAMTRKEAYRETLGAFRVGKTDILVGTQMIAKGLHFPNVTLVGIINADLTLHLPDFRAGERTFQLLTQVAGRAGRGDVPGEVFIQSHTPFHPAIQFSRRHEYEEYFQQEKEFREQWDYPPFSHMVLLHVRSIHEERAEFFAETLQKNLAQDLPEGCFLGEPAPAPIPKLKGQHRFHISLRTKSILRLSRHIRTVLQKLPLPEEVFIAVDVDPYQLM